MIPRLPSRRGAARIFKAISQLACLALVAFGGACASPSPTEDMRVPALAVAMEISDDSLVLAGRTLVLPVRKEALASILGSPDRVEKLANTILVWDSAGIIAYHAPKADDIHAITLCIRPRVGGPTPKRVFSGTLTIRGIAVTNATTLGQLSATGAKFEPIGSLWATTVAGHPLVVAGVRAEGTPYVDRGIESVTIAAP